jgi:tetratricopeptide (TPR) repeat protein
MASALKIIDSVSSDLFIVEEKTDITNNLGYLYFTTGQYDKSEKMYMLALNACYNPYIENPNKYIFHIFRVQINISSLYLAMENYENALSYGKDALVNCEMLYSIYPDFVVNEYALTLQNMAQAAAALGKKEYALEFLAKALEIKPDDPVTKELKDSLK